VVFHDPDDDQLRKLDVSGNDGGAEYMRHFDRQRDEERGEALRKLYVAVTRARHQLVLWWVGPQDSQHSALGRLLMAKGPDGEVPSSAPRRPKDDDARRSFDEVAARAPGLVRVEMVAGPVVPERAWSGRTGSGTRPLSTADFERSLDLRWRRTSYSAITAPVHGEPEVGSDPEDPGTTDEPLAGSAPEPADAGAGGTAATELRLRAVPSPWAALPGGVDVGTIVHSALEEVDFTAADLDAEITRAMGASRARPALDLLSDGMAAALRASITTPLGPLAGGMTLSGIVRADRLDELGFELPLAGGDAPGGANAVATTDIARLFEAHAEPGGPLDGYAARLRDPLLGSDLRGYLNGSLDLVFRTTVDGVPRYFVADYKTNQVGAHGAELTAWHYRPAALDDEMQRMHYPLQAIFYLVALHRYLRWRVRHYDPATHLGGALYLFLRGMSGPETPVVDGQPCGVFAWRPPTGLVTGLSDLFEVGS
jgi:exodeoxyribonuclease V beta subunit